MFSPGVVASCLGSLLCVTTTIFFFAIPDELKSAKGKVGAWGPPTGEFDWCEYNHLQSELVAEPWNTFTSLLYCAMALLAWTQHSHLGIDTRLTLLLHTINCIGIGSTLFHATLQYKMQLLDELPIYYLILLACWILYERGVHPVHGMALPALLAMWAGLMTAILETTPKDDIIHQTFRGILACSFSAGFLYTFWAASKASQEHAARVGNDDMGGLFGYGFVSIILAIVSWITDNLVCATLQNLPLGMPYPQLHAFGWHVGTAGGLYFMFLALLVQRRGIKGQPTCVDYICAGLIPVVKESRKR